MQEPETEGHKSYIVFSYMGSQRPAWVDELSLHETQRHAHEEKKNNSSIFVLLAPGEADLV